MNNKNPIYYFLAVFYLFLYIGFSSCNNKMEIDVDKELAYCEQQAIRTLHDIPTLKDIPNSINKDNINWNFTRSGSWTSGFWPGILWYLYENTQDENWKNAAIESTELILPLTMEKAKSHDSGFITMCSLGNGYRITGNEIYKEALLCAANHLAELYNPIVGTILSWPGMVTRENWPHNTIVDNMMNLELLFWAARNGGDISLYDIAVEHAETTMRNGFRSDNTNYHVVVYDTISGDFIKGVTHQGYSDDSMWARGQAWAIYGFTMTFRETRDKKFLDFAQNAADAYLTRLPYDLIPYWDFKAYEITHNEPKDASAAAIAASALLELSTFLSDRNKAKEYANKAQQMLSELSTTNYQSRDKNSAFLLHCVGHMPRRSEIDASIIYADYYYLEALIRLKNLNHYGNISSK